jgi:transcriptional regulator with XRE-family HTH domain
MRCTMLYHRSMDLKPAAVRTIRERSGQSQTAFAALLEIHRSHLSNIEAGRRRASPKVVVAIAKALKVDLDEIVA